MLASSSGSGCCSVLRSAFCRCLLAREPPAASPLAPTRTHAYARTHMHMHMFMQARVRSHTHTHITHHTLCSTHHTSHVTHLTSHITHVGNEPSTGPRVWIALPLDAQCTSLTTTRYNANNKQYNVHLVNRTLTLHPEQYTLHPTFHSTKPLNGSHTGCRQAMR